MQQVSSFLCLSLFFSHTHMHAAELPHKVLWGNYSLLLSLPSLSLKYCHRSGKHSLYTKLLPAQEDHSMIMWIRIFLCKSMIFFFFFPSQNCVAAVLIMLCSFHVGKSLGTRHEAPNSLLSGHIISRISYRQIVSRMLCMIHQKKVFLHVKHHLPLSRKNKPLHANDVNTWLMNKQNNFRKITSELGKQQ